eukprot:8513379-Lingulodinium_polyedra.AAC.1
MPEAVPRCPHQGVLCRASLQEADAKVRGELLASQQVLEERGGCLGRDGHEVPAVKAEQPAHPAACLAVVGGEEEVVVAIGPLWHCLQWPSEAGHIAHRAKAEVVGLRCRLPHNSPFLEEGSQPTLSPLLPTVLLVKVLEQNPHGSQTTAGGSCERRPGPPPGEGVPIHRQGVVGAGEEASRQGLRFVGHWWDGILRVYLGAPVEFEDCPGPQRIPHFPAPEVLVAGVEELLISYLLVAVFYHFALAKPGEEIPGQELGHCQLGCWHARPISCQEVAQVSKGPRPQWRHELQVLEDQRGPFQGSTLGQGFVVSLQLGQAVGGVLRGRAAQQGQEPRPAVAMPRHRRPPGIEDAHHKVHGSSCKGVLTEDQGAVGGQVRRQRGEGGVKTHPGQPGHIAQESNGLAQWFQPSPLGHAGVPQPAVLWPPHHCGIPLVGLVQGLCEQGYKAAQLLQAVSAHQSSCHKQSAPTLLPQVLQLLLFHLHQAFTSLGSCTAAAGC